MKFTYPAVFHKTEQGTYEGYFPDLACCYAKGDTLDEALEDAIHSAYDWISLELTEEEPDFPAGIGCGRSRKSEGEIARNIAVNIRLLRMGRLSSKKRNENRIACDIRNAAYTVFFLSLPGFHASLFFLC